jgi:hypothetical protein
VTAELAEHEAGGRAGAVLHQALEAIHADDDHAGGAGARRVERPREAVEQ